jgi:hypothetical protein
MSRQLQALTSRAGFVDAVGSVGSNARPKASWWRVVGFPSNMAEPWRRPRAVPPGEPLTRNARIEAMRARSRQHTWRPSRRRAGGCCDPDGPVEAVSAVRGLPVP